MDGKFFSFLVNLHIELIMFKYKFLLILNLITLNKAPSPACKLTIMMIS